MNNIKELINEIKEFIFECFNYINIYNNLSNIKENVAIIDKVDNNFYQYEFIEKLIEKTENNYYSLEKYASDNNRNSYYNSLFELMFYIVDIERNNNYFN